MTDKICTLSCTVVVRGRFILFRLNSVIEMTYETFSEAVQQNVTFSIQSINKSMLIYEP